MKAQWLLQVGLVVLVLFAILNHAKPIDDDDGDSSSAVDDEDIEDVVNSAVSASIMDPNCQVQRLRTSSVVTSSGTWGGIDFFVQITLPTCTETTNLPQLRATIDNETLSGTLNHFGNQRGLLQSAVNPFLGSVSYIIEVDKGTGAVTIDTALYWHGMKAHSMPLCRSQRVGIWHECYVENAMPVLIAVFFLIPAGLSGFYLMMAARRKEAFLLERRTAEAARRKAAKLQADSAASEQAEGSKPKADDSNSLKPPASQSKPPPSATATNTNTSASEEMNPIEPKVHRNCSLSAREVTIVKHEDQFISVDMYNKGTKKKGNVQLLQLLSSPSTYNVSVIDGERSRLYEQAESASLSEACQAWEVEVRNLEEAGYVATQSPRLAFALTAAMSSDAVTAGASNVETPVESSPPPKAPAASRTEEVQAEAVPATNTEEVQEIPSQAILKPAAERTIDEEKAQRIAASEERARDASKKRKEEEARKKAEAEEAKRIASERKAQQGKEDQEVAERQAAERRAAEREELERQQEEVEAKKRREAEAEIQRQAEADRLRKINEEAERAERERQQAIQEAKRLEEKETLDKRKRFALEQSEEKARTIEEDSENSARKALAADERREAITAQRATRSRMEAEAFQQAQAQSDAIIATETAVRTAIAEDEQGDRIPISSDMTRNADRQKKKESKRLKEEERDRTERERSAAAEKALQEAKEKADREKQVREAAERQRREEAEEADRLAKEQQQHEEQARFEADKARKEQERLDKIERKKQDKERREREKREQAESEAEQRRREQEAKRQQEAQAEEERQQALAKKAEEEAAAKKKADEEAAAAKQQADEAAAAAAAAKSADDASMKTPERRPGGPPTGAHVYLGMSLAELRNEKSQLVVDTLDRDGPAHAAGIQLDDVVLAIRGQELKDGGMSRARQLVVANCHVGEACEFKVQRGGEVIQCNMVPLTDEVQYSGERFFFDPKSTEKMFSPNYSPSTGRRSGRGGRGKR